MTGFRHARVDGRPNDPVHPELLGGEDWDADHIPGAILVEKTGADDADLSIEIDAEDGDVHAGLFLEATGIGDVRAPRVADGRGIVDLSTTANAHGIEHPGQAYAGLTATGDNYVSADIVATSANLDGFGSANAEVRAVVLDGGGDASVSRTATAKYADASSLARTEGTSGNGFADATSAAISDGGADAQSGFLVSRGPFNQTGLIARYTQADGQQLLVSHVPTSDPLIADAIWIDANGFMRVSTGSPVAGAGLPMLILHDSTGGTIFPSAGGAVDPTPQTVYSVDRDDLGAAADPSDYPTLPAGTYLTGGYMDWVASGSPTGLVALDIVPTLIGTYFPEGDLGPAVFADIARMTNTVAAAAKVFTVPAGTQVHMQFLQIAPELDMNLTWVRWVFWAIRLG